MASENLLEKIMTSTDNTHEAGILRDDQQKFFCEGTYIVLGSVHVYREFKPTRDSIEYTVIFKADVSLYSEEPLIEKLRVDFDLTTEEFESLDGDVASIEKSVALIAKVIARAKVVERRNQRYIESL